MSPSEIQKRLKDAGTNQRKVADKIGVRPPCVSDVIRGRVVSDKIMRAVAEAIGVDYRIVFSDYYLKPPKRKTSKVIGTIG